ncbi:prolactin-like [Erethizon dorsatum]
MITDVVPAAQVQTENREVKKYPQGTSLVAPATKQCHTADIPIPVGKEEATLMLVSPQPGSSRAAEHKDILNLVLRLLHSWNDPLKHLAQEAQRFPKFHQLLTQKEGIISDEIHQLQELIQQIISHLNFEVTNKVDYALWSEHQSLQSPDEQTSLFAFYNTLYCLVTDAEVIRFLLKLLKCRVTPEDIC